MPDFWQFPTVSMGLGPIQAIYQARFLKYLEARGIAKTANRKVWVFCGDGEMDEPESLGAINMAAREKLDNLIFVVNCNLQRLDGPVRGNGKIIQELEADFRGTGWNVIKVIWGSYWDALLSKDKRRHAEEDHDGDGRRRVPELQGQRRRVRPQELFRQGSEARSRWSRRMSDDEIWRLNRGGHDPHKVYAAYHAAVNTVGRPTVILAKTVKGFGHGQDRRGQEHHAPAEEDDGRRGPRIPRPLQPADTRRTTARRPVHPAQSRKARRSNTCRNVAPRWAATCRSVAPGPTSRSRLRTLSAFEAVTTATAEGREMSTTMAFVRILTALLRDKQLGPRVVPIIPDEARTFGMEGMFRQLGIFSQQGQLYEPVDRDQVSYYKEDKAGQILEEGINEAGAMSSWIAAATSYSTNNRIMIPFYIYYSMFGFQRIGDLAWAAGDMQARGFLLGGTAGRTTLNGEGLQHQDGHSHILSATIPNCVSYDPTFAYELAVIVQDGLKRMIEQQENVYYYITLMNENYPHPGLKVGTGGRDPQGHVPRSRAPLRPTRPGCSCSAREPSCAK